MQRLYKSSVFTPGNCRHLHNFYMYGDKIKMNGLAEQNKNLYFYTGIVCRVSA